MRFENVSERVERLLAQARKQRDGLQNTGCRDVVDDLLNASEEKVELIQREGEALDVPACNYVGSSRLFLLQRPLSEEVPGLEPNHLSLGTILLVFRAHNFSLVYDVEDVSLIALPNDVLAVRVHLRPKGPSNFRSLLVTQRVQQRHIVQELAKLNCLVARRSGQQPTEKRPRERPEGAVVHRNDGGGSWAIPHERQFTEGGSRCQDPLLLSVDLDLRAAVLQHVELVPGLSLLNNNHVLEDILLLHRVYHVLNAAALQVREEEVIREGGGDYFSSLVGFWIDGQGDVVVVEALADNLLPPLRLLHPLLPLIFHVLVSDVVGVV
mmetsp:Transcript_20158/g.37604  ORF Transcript_20158/g.37604 Transcript_20158/m.37604 type:complete len:324 (+) Transcript_20158:1550-2521(+)